MDKTGPKLKKDVPVGEREELPADKDLTKVCRDDLDEAKRLVHDLSVHQVELEMQNDELRKSYEFLATTTKKYSDLYEFAPIGYFTLDRKGIILETNLTGAKQLNTGRSRLIGRPFSSFIAPKFADIFHFHLRKTIDHGLPQASEIVLLLKNVGEMHVQISSLPLFDADGNPSRCLTAVTDISSIKEMEAALLRANTRLEDRITERTDELIQSKARFEAIFNSISDAVIFADTGRKIIQVNPAVEKLFGYNAEEILGKTARVLYAQDADFEEQGRLRYTSAKPVSPGIFEMRYRRKDGSIFTGETLGAQVTDSEGEIIGFVGVHRDITERKQIEGQLIRSKDLLDRKVRERTLDLAMANAELKAEIQTRLKTEEALLSSQKKLRSLYTHLQSMREEERTSIAREIHDELGQILTALKMDLSWIRDRIPKELDALADRTNANVELADKTIQTIKRIITELRPGILDHLGLGAAIEWQAGEFQKRTGLICDVTIGPPDIVVSPDISIALFRIFQEALTNINRHANASSVNTVLRQDAGTIRLEVSDDGAGITEEQLTQSKSFGLMGMRERAKQFDGEVVITGKPGIGTTVSVSIPLTGSLFEQ